MMWLPVCLLSWSLVHSVLCDGGGGLPWPEKRDRSQWSSAPAVYRKAFTNKLTVGDLVATTGSAIVQVLK